MEPHANCFICQRIKMIQTGTNPWFVKELTTGYVVLADTQYFPGYTIFIAKEHFTELHQLAPALRAQFMMEMSWVSEAAAMAFSADKMNLEMLGNGDSHVHWHIFPRHEGDTPQPGPVWWVAKDVMYADAAAPSARELATAKQCLANALTAVMAKYH